MRPTTKDLAKVAGVSRATVDRVLNGREGVKQKTIDRVNEAIRELGFVRNLSAANLAKKKSYRYVFVLPRSGDLFLQEIMRHVREAETILVDDMMSADIVQLDENDPHGIAAYLGTLTTETVDGVAIMAPESPQVRDAIVRLNERGVRALPFVSNQTLTDNDWVGIDNRAAGATAGTLLGRFLGGVEGNVLIVSETMKSRDSLERRFGFDQVINSQFPRLRALPSLETYGSMDRAEAVIRATASRQKIAAAYILASEARGPLTVLRELGLPGDIVTVAHERTPYTEEALRSGDLDAVISQDAGHLARSAIRKLKAMTDRRSTLLSQEKIRIEILLAANL
ncbi:LacI family DNA-binding transcriptional regulator [Roseibium aggregatum]|uniref:LacI family DNA-binding transcriptional regulator n=1 Tax=Roseibium aggregatum TaxID=187304 RepID=A0A939J2E1_9HYPH|nr:LacI family DNA-binding transcriptional regulator [Roseibium aggregatum]MBN9669447.1 LacI family DNA-binding transcriptional regulator [Roseibium aggregatum]